jgi:hypothetical protein
MSIFTKFRPHVEVDIEMTAGQDQHEEFPTQVTASAPLYPQHQEPVSKVPTELTPVGHPPDRIMIQTQDGQSSLPQAQNTAGAIQRPFNFGQGGSSTTLYAHPLMNLDSKPSRTPTPASLLAGTFVGPRNQTRTSRSRSPTPTSSADKRFGIRNDGVNQYHVC